ncbi:MAG: alpha-glucosidase [Clostridiales bacterium]|nr:alpha-glucosidase [Clostridiales bacterium]
MARAVLDKTKRGWWKSAVFYELYPRSFQDTTGTGIGDLKGVISRLDYLETLGIDAIWLCPICASPQVDNGYDISDFCAIDPLFGTMQDMETLIAEAKKRGIGILVDLTLNHSSNQHRWFREALKSRDNPFHDYYVWRDGGPDTPPNDMRAGFGGSAWEYVPELGQWYFHQFAPEQPDLNWDNPTLRQELYRVLRFWVDKGVAGFRLDVIDQIAKDPDRKITINGPRLHEFFREMSREALLEEGLVTVGEAWGADTQRAKLYSTPDGSELSMVFQFEHIGLDQQPGKDKWDMAPLSLPRLKDCLRRWQQELHNCGWNSLFFNNHDLPRIVSRWGNDRQYRAKSAKMLATMLYGLQGTPYIYQGEELGMTNIRLELEQYQDLETLNLFRERTAQGYAPEAVMESIWARGRDNARTPMQWTAGENAGFTTGTPWLPVNENYLQINAEAELADPDSVFHYYQRLISLRKTYPVFRDGYFTLLCPEDERIFAYTRDTEQEHLLVVCNFSDEQAAFDLPEEYRDAQVLISNDSQPETRTLRPWEAWMLYR